MESQHLAAQILALPEPARLAIEQLVVLLSQQPAGKKMPPILRPAVPLTAEEIVAEQAERERGVSFRPDITDGADYIHQVRRGLRQP